MDPAEFLRNGPVSVPAETHAVCRTDCEHPGAFATVREVGETTVVVDQDEADAVTTDAVEPGWKRLTFEPELPFELVWFLAAVATALAEVDASVFVVSSYATDHVFVKRDDRAAPVRRLEALGCEVAD
ncbi:ACT domain-containing protein [Halorubrum ezzemoulense]|uniref:ACT domain-containing protein n=1 Tax=Halorubrum ezzemoulense TaxID=337243 RepID=UPI003D7D39ED